MLGLGAIRTLADSQTVYLSRPRLLEPLRRSQHRLVLLCAPAGFGKSALLGEYVQHRPAAQQVWLNLGGQPLTFARFIERLNGALMLPADGGAEALLHNLVNRERALDLVLDDLRRAQRPRPG